MRAMRCFFLFYFYHSAVRDGDGDERIGKGREERCVNAMRCEVFTALRLDTMRCEAKRRKKNSFSTFMSMFMPMSVSMSVYVCVCIIIALVAAVSVFVLGVDGDGEGVFLERSYIYIYVCVCVSVYLSVGICFGAVLYSV